MYLYIYWPTAPPRSPRTHPFPGSCRAPLAGAPGSCRAPPAGPFLGFLWEIAFALEFPTIFNENR